MTQPRDKQETICKRYKAGATMQELSDEFHMSTATVRYILIENNISRRPKGPVVPVARIHRVAMLRDSEGMSWAEIAQDMGTTAAEATRQYNAFKVDQTRPETIGCPRCNGGGSVPNPEKLYATD